MATLMSRLSDLAARIGTEIKADRAAIALKAPLASPVLTGDPKAPTPAAGDNDTSIATTAFATTADNQRLLWRGVWAASSVYAVNDVLTSGGVLYIVKTAFTSGATFTTTNMTAIAQIDVSTFATISALNTRMLFRGAWAASTVYALNDVLTNAGVLYIVKTAFTSGTTFSATNLTAIGVSDLSAYATLASPVLTGDPQAPTPASTDSDTSIATTGFVKNQGYAPLASPILTGDPQAPTPAATDNDTSIATTAFVKGQGYAPLASPIFTGDPTVPDPVSTDNDFSIANTGWVTRLTGTAADWVAQFQQALTAPVGALAASKTVPGVVQLGTAAEMLAGINDTHAVTAASMFNAKYAVDLDDLNAKAAVLPPGSLICLLPQSFAGNGSIPEGTILRSIWWVGGGKASPATTITVSSDAFASQANGLAAVLPRPNILLEAGVSTVAVVGGQKYVWSGTAWVRTSEGLITGWVLDSNVIPWDNTGSFINEFRLIEGGKEAQFTMGLKMANLGMFPTTQRLAYGFAYAPKRAYQGSVSLYGANGWDTGSANVNVDSSGAVSVNGVTSRVNAQQGVFGTFRWPLT